jgi:hypothetical protein
MHQKKEKEVQEENSRTAVTPKRKDTDLPGNCWKARAIFIYEVAPRIEDPAMMKGHQSMSCSSRVVLPILTVCILEWGKLIFPQYFIHHKLPRVTPYKGFILMK